MIPRLAANWYDVGLKLGAKAFTLNNIKATPKEVCECCKEMLQNWLNGKADCGVRDHPVTWETLLHAVECAVGSEASKYIRTEVLKMEDGNGTLKRDSSEPCMCVWPNYSCCDVTPLSHPTLNWF